MKHLVTYNEIKLTKVWLYDKDKTTKKFKTLDLLKADYIKLVEANKRRISKGRSETIIKVITNK